MLFISVEATQKATLPQKGVSWDFDGDDVDEQIHTSDSTPVRKPRTVTFEPTNRPVSSATTDSIASSGAAGTPIIESRSLDTFPDDGVSSQIAMPASGDKPTKKSRFVVEDTIIPAVASSPGTDVSQAPSGATSPHPSYNTASTGSVQSGQNLHGLGVSSSGAEKPVAPEVKKGRFSVKDTLSITSPTPGSLKAAAGNEALLSPSRSLSSSPIEGIADGVQIGAPLELVPSGKICRTSVSVLDFSDG